MLFVKRYYKCLMIGLMWQKKNCYASKAMEFWTLRKRYTSSCYTALSAISDALERYWDKSNLKRCGVLGNPQCEILLWQP